MWKDTGENSVAYIYHKTSLEIPGSHNNTKTNPFLRLTEDGIASFTETQINIFNLQGIISEKIRIFLGGICDTYRQQITTDFSKEVTILTECCSQATSIHFLGSKGEALGVPGG
jgi:hypothetical protein